MKNHLFLILLSLVSGALIPIQASTNAAFSKATSNPVITGLMVLLVGMLAILLYTFITRTPFPDLAQLKNAPSYSYLGGLVVAFYVIVITFITPQLGVAASIGLIITGQIIGAVIVDHFGIFDTVVRPIDFKRLSGTLCMIVGIYLVMKK